LSRDYRVPASAAYYIASVLNTTTWTPWVDGTFTDDVTGLPAEHGSAPANMKNLANGHFLNTVEWPHLGLGTSR
jgi:hypothetical protein